MPPPEGIEMAQGRLATFQVAHPVKRRASTAKKRGGTTLKWPHKQPSPESLSQAGFYFLPSASSPDNCQCFICNVNLDGWEPEDDPALEHYAHRADCPWAVSSYVKRKFESGEPIEEDPMSDAFAHARAATFEAWPHESKRGWKCKTEKMVEAGWYFDPSPGMEDGVTCAYCGTEIGGWERKDDPFEEHLKRDPDCPFFALCDRFAASRPAKPKKARTSKQSRTSKASRASTQSVTSVQLETLSTADLDESLDTGAAEDDTVLTTATTASKSTRGRKKVATTTKATKGRPKKTVVLDESSVAGEDEGNVSLAPVRQTRRKASRQVSVQVDTSLAEAEPKPSRSRSKKVAQLASIEQKATRPTRGRNGASTESDKEESIQSDVTVLTTSQLPKNPKGTKRTSDGNAKPLDTLSRLTSMQQLESSVVILDEAPAIFEDENAKQKKQPKKNTSLRQPLQDLPVEDSKLEQEYAMLRSSGMHNATTSTPKQTPEPSPTEEATSPDPPTPTPAKPAMSANKRGSARSRRTTTPKPHRMSASTAKNLATPNASPQSSDAENKPPSARPEIQGLQLNPISPMRMPLQSTPRTSPSKRNGVSRLRTEFPWSPSNLEAVFMSVSPKKRSQSDDKENFVPGNATLDMDKLDKKSLPQVVKAVKESMTEEERKMTVEQWITFTATKGEEKLKVQCETMVTMFEREGAKAFRALEGIQTLR